MSAAFLSVPELARLLHLNEKKIYQLAGDGVLPGTKITGKWIFPARLIEDWIVENSHGGVLADRLILSGSDDRLMERVCQSLATELGASALISYSACGTRHGLSLLDCHRVDGTFINWGASESHARRHQGLLRTYRNHSSWVLVRCAERWQGLILGRQVTTHHGRDTSQQLDTLLKDASLAWAMREDDTGAERLLSDTCAQHGIRHQELNSALACHCERSAAAAVNQGDADLATGAQSTAAEFGLEFVPIARVAIDLVVPRRTYFRALLQRFVKRLQEEPTHELARSLPGYHLPADVPVMSMDPLLTGRSDH